MFTADMHCDSLLRVAQEGGTLRTAYNVPHAHPHLQCFAVFSADSRLSPEARRKQTVAATERYLAACAEEGICRVLTGEELADPAGLCALLTLEGGGGLYADSPELLLLRRWGLAVAGIIWCDNELGCSSRTGEDTGLTPAGRDMVQRLDELGIIPDLSHLSDRSFWEVLSLGDFPVLATHSNFRSVCDHPRNLTRAQALAIAERGGLIGLNIYPPFLQKGPGACMENLLAHIDYGLSLVGAEHIAFGMDIDGIEEYPAGAERNAPIHDRAVELLLQQYPARVVEKIAGENVRRFLRAHLPRPSEK